MLKSLWMHLPKRRQNQFGLLVILMLFASFAEIISIGSVLPFLGVLTKPEQIFQHQLTQPLIQALEITRPEELIFPFTIIFIVSAILAGIIRIALLYVMTRFSFSVGADLSINIYRRTLYQDYSIHVSRNSSEVINGIITKTGTVISSILSPILTIISSIILFIGIIGALFTIDIQVALTASIGFGLLYWMVIRHTRQQLEENSRIISEESTQMIKTLQEGLGGIRDVLIDGSQEFYCNLYRSADLPLRRASGNNVFISASPRYVMEAIGMSLIAALAYLMIQQSEEGVAMVIPTLGAFALGAQRLLPALQQVYASYSRIKGARSSFSDVLDLLNQPLPAHTNSNVNEQVEFEKEVQLRNVSFRYANDLSWILKDIDLTINKGDRIGFVGTTGSGKSTLLDIVMGLLKPASGELVIDENIITDDNRYSWQAHVSHVPQNIYLSDSTIEENIAFGVSRDNINHERVEQAARQAQISDLIDGWKDGYRTIVGECGVRLSGGQRQRIGIARALYRQANLLIFDEATSALDNETEQAVMEAIEGLGSELTILIIAHRLTTLTVCNKIIKLDQGNVVCAGSYQEMINEK